MTEKGSSPVTSAFDNGLPVVSITHRTNSKGLRSALIRAFTSAETSKADADHVYDASNLVADVQASRLTFESEAAALIESYLRGPSVEQLSLLLPDVAFLFYSSCSRFDLGSTRNEKMKTPRISHISRPCHPGDELVCIMADTFNSGLFDVGVVTKRCAEFEVDWLYPSVLLRIVEDFLEQASLGSSYRGVHVWLSL